MSKIVVGRSNDDRLMRFLARHPFVVLEGESRDGYLDFAQGSWKRSIKLDSPAAELIELADNNPFVCADLVEVPNAEMTLTRLALQPILQTGLVVEDPAIMLSFDPVPSFESDVEAALGIEPAIQIDEVPMGSVVSINSMVEIEGFDSPDQLDEVYREAYGRSFFVREATAEWDTKLVAESPFACYRLRLSETPDHPLLTIQAMLDRNGKGGAAQVIHTMNVMCGFEESVGI